MKILFFCWGTSLTQLGVRYLASYVRGKGHEAAIVFLPKPGQALLAEAESRAVVELVCREKPDVLAFSVLTMHSRSACELSRKIREHWPVPQAWGGVGVTLTPEWYLENADVVCVGEGEEPFIRYLAALEAGQGPAKVPNLVYKEPGKVIRTPVESPLLSADDYPFPDWNPENHFLLHEGMVHCSSQALEQNYIPLNLHSHYVMTARGCMFRCTYCMGDVSRLKLDIGYRGRSPESVIEEMEGALKQRPQIRSLVIVDPYIHHRGLKWTGEFSALYKERVGLPFFTYMTIKRLDEESFDTLLDAGLTGVTLTAGSVSKELNRTVFKRAVDPEAVTQMVEAVNLRRDKLPYFCFDVLVDNPFETPEDEQALLKVMMQAKRPYKIMRLHFLMYEGMGTVEAARRLELPDLERLIRETEVRGVFTLERSHFNRLTLVLPWTPRFLAAWFIRHYQSRVARGSFLPYFVAWRVGNWFAKRGYLAWLRFRDKLRPYPQGSREAVFLEFGI